MPKRKQRKNLLLDVEAIQRAERYGRLHGTSLSQLVNAYLRSLPADDPEQSATLTPRVQRLVGIAAGAGGVEEYHRYLEERYGR